MTAIGKAVIVGGGIDAWLAANALLTAFGRTGLSVEVIETPAPRPAGAARASTPGFRAFLSLIGIVESDLLRAAQGSYCLAQRNVGWRGDGTSFLRGYGPIGIPIARLPFLPFWVKARRHGMHVDLASFSTAAVAAGNGRAPGRSATASAGAPIDYGYQFDLGGCVALLAAAARHRGAMVTTATAVMPLRDSATGRIDTIRLADGRTVSGDIFIDATGAEMKLGPALNDAERSRRRGDPDRLFVASAPRAGPLYPLTTVTAHPHGWLTTIALRDRIALQMSFAGDRLSDDAAARTAEALAGAPLDRGGVIALESHRRAAPWAGNCVAIGNAACAGPDLDGAELQRLQISVAHLVSLFPLGADMATEAAIYNERVAEHFDRLDDGMDARRRLNARSGEPFWDEARAAPISDRLTHRLAVFAARGIMPLYQDESLGEEDWQALLIGMGVIPESYDPQIDRVPDSEAIGRIQSLLGAIRREVEAMPPHEQALAEAMAPRR